MAATEVRAHRGGGASGVQALAQMADLLDPAVARFIQDRGLYAEADSASAPTIDPHVGSDEIA
jgi:hypothetical protein